uniref:Uncharacterized protein n=1 Tax=Biomphalaria glabrata TaxID=6526 RepID=A0A2C9KX32_BIOGL
MGEYDAKNFKLEKIQPEGVSTFGKHFVLAYPGYNTPLPNAVNLRLLLYTYNVEEFYVTVSRRGSDWEDQADFLISSGQHYTLYEENDFVGFEPIAQTRWTNTLKAAYTFSCLVYAFIPKLYNIVAYFQAVPVEGWGRRYTVITPSFRPSIQIVNGPMNQSITLYPNEAGKTELTKYFKDRDGHFKHSFVFHLDR